MNRFLNVCFFAIISFSTQANAFDVKVTGARTLLFPPHPSGATQVKITDEHGWLIISKVLSHGENTLTLPMSLKGDIIACINQECGEINLPYSFGGGRNN